MGGTQEFHPVRERLQAAYSLLWCSTQMAKEADLCHDTPMTLEILCLVMNACRSLQHLPSFLVSPSDLERHPQLLQGFRFPRSVTRLPRQSQRRAVLPFGVRPGKDGFGLIARQERIPNGLRSIVSLQKVPGQLCRTPVPGALGQLLHRLTGGQVQPSPSPRRECRIEYLLRQSVVETKPILPRDLDQPKRRRVSERRINCIFQIGAILNQRIHREQMVESECGSQHTRFLEHILCLGPQT
jgi:hypothetical protein